MKNAITDIHSFNSAPPEDQIRMLRTTILARLRVEEPTLRDQFAMEALNGLCSLNWRTEEIPTPTAKDHAVMAYKYADAMLEARK